MPISKTITIMFLASVFFIFSTVIAQDKLITPEPSASSGISDEGVLLLGLLDSKKGQAGLPKDLESQAEIFKLDLKSSPGLDLKSSPGLDLKSSPGLDENRSPASTSTSKGAPKKTAASWTSTTSDGFQFKIRIKQQVSAVWVMKRNDHFDLIFANNNGSRVSLAIPAEQFYALKDTANDLRAPASDMSKCEDYFVQLEMVDAKTHKLVSACLSAKSKQADQLRQFGNVLNSYIR